MGDGVNMAARFMSYTDPEAQPRLTSQILVDEETFNSCPDLEFGPSKEIYLKGKTLPVSYHLAPLCFGARGLIPPRGP